MGDDVNISSTPILENEKRGEMKDGVPDMENEKASFNNGNSSEDVEVINENENDKPCKNKSCDNKEDNSNMLTCSKCGGKFHYRCTRLPAYQVALYLTRGHRSYRCASCVKVKSELVAICCSNKELEKSLADGNNEITLKKAEADSEMIVNLKGLNKELVESNQKLEQVIEHKTQEISNLEAFSEGLKTELNDKEIIIKSQKEVLENMRKLHESRNEEKELDTKNVQTEKVSEIENSDVSRQLSDDKDEKIDILNQQIIIIKKKYADIEQLNIDLARRLNEKALLMDKTEIAFKTKDELLEAKNEIIGNLKKIIGNLETNLQIGSEASSTNLKHNLTSNGETCVKDKEDGDDLQSKDRQNSDVQSKDTINHGLGNGVKETCEYVEIHGENGAIMNGILMWINIQRQMFHENKWKSKIVDKFSAEEISDAKETLWRISGKSISVASKKRQGPSKSISEVNDICSAIDELGNKGCMPLFLATTGIIKTTPLCEPVSVESAILENFKCIENENRDVKEKLTALEKTIKDIPMSSPHCHDISPDEIADDIRNGEGLAEITLLPQAVNKRTTTNITELNNKGVSKKEGDWETARNKKSWKNKMQNIQGTSEDNGISWSADIYLVVYKVSKDVSGTQIAQWLANKGLQIKTCELLTTYEGSRSLTYKISIKASDEKKALSPDIWPSGVGVRRFKPFPEKKSNVKKNNMLGRQRLPEKQVWNLMQNGNQTVTSKPVLGNSERNLPPEFAEYQYGNLNAMYPGPASVNDRRFQRSNYPPIPSNLSETVPKGKSVWDYRHNYSNIGNSHTANGLMSAQNNAAWSNDNHPVLRFDENLTDNCYV